MVFEISRLLRKRWIAERAPCKRAALAILFIVVAASAQPPLKVRLKPAVSESTVDMPVEKYVAAVVAAESNIFRSDEALKAMAVAARSYALYFRARHASEGYDLCGTTHCQRIEPSLVTPRIEAAVTATTGEILWHEGKPVFASYSRDCGGVTEDSSAVWNDPGTEFLRSRTDPYCTRQGPAPWHWSASLADISLALQRSQLLAPPALAWIAVVNKTPSGRARELMLTGTGPPVRLAASSFRFAMGRALGFNTVRSDRWEVTAAGGRLHFRGLGDGHGVGLCQKGADQMGLEGHGYREILSFYYSGAAAGIRARGIAWTRLGGENVALFTTQPEQDGPVLALAERQLREVARQLDLPAAAGIEIRLYPDLEAFRNATGEPGWIAGRTTGRRIELQPVSVLRSRGALEITLRHELIHAVLEAQAAPNLPVWFREGLAVYFAAGPAAPSTGESADAAIRQREDASAARRANVAAGERVAALVKRYGLGTVVSWLKSGLPREVATAKASSAPTANK